jgi:uncharacterized membrane protein
MKPEHLLYLISVWIHIASAMIWVGGSAFLAIVAVPVLRRGEHKAAAPSVIAGMASRFRMVGWASLAVLAATGTLNLELRGYGWKNLKDGSLFDGSFGHALAVKLSLVAAILFVSALHDFAPGPRRRASRFGRIVLLLGMGVVAAAAYLVRG